MEIVDRPETTVVGVAVEAAFADLATAVPAAWREVITRSTELPGPAGRPLAEVSRHLGAGRYRETVGALADPAYPAPPGMTRTTVPAGRYVHHRHDGPVEAIADAYRAVYDWASAQGLELGPHKLDIGYTTDGRQGPHDLFVDVRPTASGTGPVGN